MDVSDKIKQLVSINDLLNRYGYHVERKGFISCPFHNEKTSSLKIYPESNSFHCFGCGANGDVIKFVMLLFAIDFKHAIKRIDIDFCLSLFEKPKLSEVRKNDAALQILQKQKQLKEDQQKYNKYAYKQMVLQLHYLWSLPDSPEKQHDINHLRRLMNQFIEIDNYNCMYDVNALIASLNTKFKEV